MVWEQLLPHALLAHWTEGSSWFHLLFISFQKSTSFLLFYMIKKMVELFDSAMHASINSIILLLMMLWPESVFVFGREECGGEMISWAAAWRILPTAVILRRRSLSCIETKLPFSCFFKAHTHQRLTNFPVCNHHSWSISNFSYGQCASKQFYWRTESLTWPPFL